MTSKKIELTSNLERVGIDSPYNVTSRGRVIKSRLEDSIFKAPNSSEAQPAPQLMTQSENQIPF